MVILMIQEIMILNKAGIALFYHNFTSRKMKDIQIVASYFDLICRYTKSSLNETLKSFSLQDRKIFFYSHNSGLHVVFICENKAYKEKIFNYLADLIIQKFTRLYNKELERFSGEISAFKSFSKELERTIKPNLLDRTSIPTLDH